MISKELSSDGKFKNVSVVYREIDTITYLSHLHSIEITISITPLGKIIISIFKSCNEVAQ